jgi:hypothetical protein
VAVSNVPDRLRVAAFAIAIATVGCGWPIATPSVVGLDAPHNLHPALVEAIVQDRVAANVRVLGGVLRPLRISRIELLQPGGEFTVEWPDGTGITVITDPGERIWVVEAEGTFRDCRGGECDTWERGVVFVDDGTGAIEFAWDRDGPHPWQR